MPEAVQRLDGVVDGALEVDVDVGDAGGSGGAPHHDEGEVGPAQRGDAAVGHLDLDEEDAVGLALADEADEALADARLLQGPHGQGVALLGGPLLGAADDLEDGLPHGRVEAGEGHGQGAGAAAGQAAGHGVGLVVELVHGGADPRGGPRGDGPGAGQGVGDGGYGDVGPAGDVLHGCHVRTSLCREPGDDPRRSVSISVRRIPITGQQIWPKIERVRLRSRSPWRQSIVTFCLSTVL